MLKLLNVSTTVGNFKLENINLEVKEGEILVILGLSGAGKTTLLKTILGIYRVRGNGKIYFNGKDITHYPINKRGIAFVPQSLVLYPNKTIYENIDCALKLQKVGKKIREKRINDILKFMQLDYKRDSYPDELSGGEKQKLSIARAFVLNSPLIIMDEPLTNIDLPKRMEILRLIKELRKKFNKTVIYVTHQLSEASCLATKIAIMREGKIVRVGTISDLLRDPQKIFIAELLNFENIFQGRIIEKNDRKIAEITNKNGKKVHVQLVGSVEKNEEVTVTIRPEDVIVSTKPLDSVSARNCLKGKIIEIIETLEGTIKIKIDCGIILTVLITRSSYEELQLKEGTEVYAVFKATAIKIVT